MTKYQLGKQKAFEVIKTYPVTANWSHFLTMKNGKKLFFDIFIKKYGLNGSPCKYMDIDVYRRMKVIECFEYFLKNFDITKEEHDVILIDTKFFRFVIRKHALRNNSIKYELLSFFDR